MNSSHEDREYSDFCGNHQPDFSLVKNEKFDQLMASIDKNLFFSEVVKPFEEDLDQLAYCAVYAFSQGKLTRAQTATFLEYRSIKKDFPNVSIIDVDFNSLLNPETYNLILYFFKGQESMERFREIMKNQPRFEACYFKIDIPEEHIKNERLNGFIELANQLRVIQKSKTPMIQVRSFTEEIGEAVKNDEPANIIMGGSVGIKNAVTKAIYGEHAKEYYSRLSEFTIDMIGESIENRGRYVSVDYPGIPTKKSFHKIESSAVYATLHDEVHRRLTSTIPNPVYLAFIDAIKMVKEKTNIKWSREIWDAMDMEVGEFLNFTIDYQKYNEMDIVNNTNYFLYLLNANVYTQNKPAALFTNSPYLDTTWLILIDIALEPDKWLKRGIDFNRLINSNYYKLMYDVVIKNKDKIKNLSFTEQVLLVKSDWFNIPYDINEKKETTFERENAPKQPRYIQAKADGKILISNKRDALQNRKLAIEFSKKSYEDTLNLLYKMEESTLALLNYAAYDPYLFDEIINNNFSSLIKNQKIPINVMKNIIDAKLRFAVFSIPNLATFFHYIKNDEDRSNIISANKKLIGQLEWKLSDLHKFVHTHPNHAQEIINAIILEHREHKNLLQLISELLEYIGDLKVEEKLKKSGSIGFFDSGDINCDQDNIHAASALLSFMLGGCVEFTPADLNAFNEKDSVLNDLLKSCKHDGLTLPKEIEDIINSENKNEFK